MITTLPQISDCNKPAENKPVSSTELFQGRRVLEIIHLGQRYVLRITRENKLLLTK